MRILSITKEFERELKKSQKGLNKLKKRMKELNLDRNSSKDSIYAVLNEATEIWRNLQKSGLNKRISVQELLTEDEWEMIIANSIDELSKKEVKNQEKDYKNFIKEFDKLYGTIAKQTTDVERMKKIDQALVNFKSLTKNYMDANKERSLRYNDAFRNLNATKSDLTDALSSVEEARSNLFEGVVNLHFKLVESTTEDEWIKIAKAVNKHF